MRLGLIKKMTITLIRNPLRATMDRKTVTHSLCS